MKRRFATDFATCLLVLAAPTFARADDSPPATSPAAPEPLPAPQATEPREPSGPVPVAPNDDAASPSPSTPSPSTPTTPPSADAAEVGQGAALRPTPPTFAVAPLSVDRASETPSGPRHDVRLGAGLRVGYIPTSGFDRFSSNDVLPQLSVDANVALIAGETFSFALGAAYDVGGVSSALRGFDTKLTVHRVTVPLEGRLHATHGIFAFLRVAPGAAAFVTSIEDPSAPASLDRTAWAFAADASLGASFLLGPHGAPSKRQVRFWLTPEVGYAFTTSPSLRTSPNRDADEALGTDGETKLGSLSTSGFFWRASLAVSF